MVLLDYDEVKTLKKLSISSLIFIILHKQNTKDKNNDLLRKYAEIELKQRVKNIGCDFDDLLHFDDKVFKERGDDIDSYLISPKVNMQQLMETYFMYSCQTKFDDNCLLFSEKHLCNESDFATPFFNNICEMELANIYGRIAVAETKEEKDNLILFKKLLEDRKDKREEEKKKALNGNLIGMHFHNDAMLQLRSIVLDYREYLANYSDEEMYKILKSSSGQLRFFALDLLNEFVTDSDLVQYLTALRFISKDSNKLRDQKNRLAMQARNVYSVDYGTETMQKALQRLNKGQ